jgi:hypothetical protein
MSIMISDLPAQVRMLLDQRDRHVEAIASIDHTLTKVNSALGTNGAVAPAPARKASPAPAVKASKAAAPAKRRTRRRFAVSGAESILAFVKAKKNPTTQEIKKNWTSEGRGTGADNTLSLLAKEKKLKRTPLGKGIRGSRFTLL